MRLKVKVHKDWVAELDRLVQAVYVSLFGED